MMDQIRLDKFGTIEEIVPSKSRPHIQHVVVVDGGVPWCSCEGFQFRNKCCHIDEFLPDVIYCTVDPKDIREVPDDDRFKILTLLESDKNKWFKAYDIALACDYPTGVTQVEVRKAITFLIEVDHIPIVSGSKGFKYAESMEEIETYIQSLQGRVNGIMRRIVALKKMRVN